MKKALVILLAIFMVGAAFADDVVAPTFSGSVTATWGKDFENDASGFKNESDAKVTFPLAKFGNKAQGGEGMYGEITVKDFGLTVDTKDGLKYKGDDFAIEGKIHFGNGLYMGVYKNPSLDYNFAENLRKHDAGVPYTDVNVSNDWIITTGGIELGYASDMVTVRFRDASIGDWDKANAKSKIDAKKNNFLQAQTGQDAAVADNDFNKDDRYVYQAAVTLKPVKDLLTVDFAYTFLNEFVVSLVPGPKNKKPMNMVNAKVATKVASFEASIGADVALYDKEEGFQIGFISQDPKYYMKLNPTELLDYSAKGADPSKLENTMALDFAPAVSYTVVDGFKVGAKAWAFAAPMKDSKADMPMDLRVYVEEQMDKGFVAPLSAKLTFGLDDVLGNKDYYGYKADDEDFKYSLSLETAYKVIPGVKVSANAGYNYKEEFTAGAGLELGADFHKVAKTTFSVTYSDYKYVKEGSADNLGTLKLAAKIAF